MAKSLLLKTARKPAALCLNSINCMAVTLNSAEEAQLNQTIEMFEVITQSQPHDCQSLEILKEAYTKLGRDQDAVAASKRIAKAYLELGQLSSAILEYETILQRVPGDPDVQEALRSIESKAGSFPSHSATETLDVRPTLEKAPAARPGAKPSSSAPADDGRRAMYKLFVESKLISAGDFDLCWPAVDMSAGTRIQEPFVQALADKGLLPVDKSLKIISDKSRCAYLPLGSYETDIDLARSFPAEVCRKWCVLPFDRMSKSIFVATTNPFNQQAAKELAAETNSRLLWYLVTPADLMKNLQKAFR